MAASVKQSQVITYQKTFENPNIVDIKSILQNIQNLHINYLRLDKFLVLGSNSSLYSGKKSEKFLNEKNVTITKLELPFTSFASTYDVGILNSSDRELQLKETESAIKSKLIELLTQLKAFKFVTTLI